jgi:hypothetical protein
MDAEPLDDAAERRRDDDPLEDERQRRGKKEMRRVLNEGLPRTEAASTKAWTAKTVSSAYIRSW